MRQQGESPKLNRNTKREDKPLRLGDDTQGPETRNRNADKNR